MLFYVTVSYCSLPHTIFVSWLLQLHVSLVFLTEGEKGAHKQNIERKVEVITVAPKVKRGFRENDVLVTGDVAGLMEF